MLDSGSAFDVALHLELVLVGDQTLQQVALIDLFRQSIGANLLQDLHGDETKL